MLMKDWENGEGASALALWFFKDPICIPLNLLFILEKLSSSLTLFEPSEGIIFSMILVSVLLLDDSSIILEELLALCCCFKSSDKDDLVFEGSSLTTASLKDIVVNE